MKKALFEAVTHVVQSLDINTVSEDRQKTLQPLIDYLQVKLGNNEAIRLNFICTHNSRRSHLSQIWAQTMAAYYDINKVSTYSGGTEATALFPKIAETLTNQGFKISILSVGKNPVYCIKYGRNEAGIIAFSKKFNASFNPETVYAAILTCSSADQGCPVVFGCDIRIPITYMDPKKSDNTPRQSEIYLERSLQIATEMKYVFSSLK